MENTPRTVSVSLQQGHLAHLNKLAEIRATRNVYATRSALVREALAIGLRALMENERHSQVVVVSNETQVQPAQ